MKTINQKYHSAYILDGDYVTDTFLNQIKTIPSVYLKNIASSFSKLVIVAWDYEPDLLIALETTTWAKTYKGVRWDDVNRIILS